MFFGPHCFSLNCLHWSIHFGWLCPDLRMHPRSFSSDKQSMWMIAACWLSSGLCILMGCLCFLARPHSPLTFSLWSAVKPQCSTSCLFSIWYLRFCSYCLVHFFPLKYPSGFSNYYWGLLGSFEFEPCPLVCLHFLSALYTPQVAASLLLRSLNRTGPAQIHEIRPSNLNHRLVKYGFLHQFVPCL